MVALAEHSASPDVEGGGCAFYASDTGGTGGKGGASAYNRGGGGGVVLKGRKAPGSPRAQSFSRGRSTTREDDEEEPGMRTPPPPAPWIVIKCGGCDVVSRGSTSGNSSGTTSRDLSRSPVESCRSRGDTEASLNSGGGDGASSGARSRVGTPVLSKLSDVVMYECVACNSPGATGPTASAGAVAAGAPTSSKGTSVLLSGRSGGRAGSGILGAPLDACGQMWARFETLSPSGQLFCLACGVFVFFGVNNFLQEAIVRMDGFRFGWALGMFEMVGVAVSTTVERCVTGERERRASLRSYFVLTLCLAASSSLSTIALNYINYPTKIVFRSCKLLPTVAIAVLWSKRPVKIRELAAALAVCGGLVVFAMADFNVSPNFDWRGIALVLLSVCADALLPILQERAFDEGASRSEMMFYTNLCTMATMSFTVGLSGNLTGAVRYAAAHPLALAYIATYTFVAYFAIFFHMNLVKRFGGVTTVFVGSARKALTIIVSFVVFDKPFSYLYCVAGLLVLAGLLGNAWGAEPIEHRRSADKQRGSSDAGSGRNSPSDGGGGGGGSYAAARKGGNAASSWRLKAVR